MFERPAFVHRLLEFLCDEVIAPFLKMMRNEAGNPELIMDGRDAWASPPMISLDMMGEYVVAYTDWRTFISKSRKERALQNLCVKRGNHSTINGYPPAKINIDIITRFGYPGEYGCRPRHS